MRAAAEWVPMRWPEPWDKTKAELLRGTAINCLIGGPEVEGFDSPRDLGGVRQIEKAAWPGLPEKSWESAGPTGNPWVDANGWQVRLERAKAPDKPVWVCSEKPKGMNPALAVADAAHCGGRWLVTLTDELASGVAGGNAAAMTAWKELAAAVGFFERHRAWATMPAAAKLAIVSAFEDTNSGEVLNLATRRHLAYRIVEKSAPGITFAGMEAVLYLDDEPPAAALLQTMTEFGRGGGLLMTPRKTAAQIPGVGAVIETQQRTVVHKLGKGRLAMPLKEWDDPFLLASDAHLLLSYRHDPVRLFNAGILIPYVTTDGRRTVAQIVNYAGWGSANFVTLGLPATARHPRLWTLEADEGRAMEIHKETGRPELHLPEFRNYAAIEFEG